MILKLKALLYRHTGIYLANREELEYLKSEEFWKEFRKICVRKTNDLTLADIQGLLLGLWQAENGFYRTSKLPRD